MRKTTVQQIGPDAPILSHTFIFKSEDLCILGSYKLFLLPSPANVLRGAIHFAEAHVLSCWADERVKLKIG